MRILPMFCGLVVCACGPDVSAWRGAWAGAAVINAGRAPEVYNGTLTIADGARFEAKSEAVDGKAFTCALTASMVDGASAAFSVPASCAMSATPADDCTYQVTFNSASATRDGDKLEGVANGRMTSTCTTSSSKALDFALTLSATRR